MKIKLLGTFLFIYGGCGAASLSHNFFVSAQAQKTQYGSVSPSLREHVASWHAAHAHTRSYSLMLSYVEYLYKRYSSSLFVIPESDIVHLWNFFEQWAKQCDDGLPLLFYLDTDQSIAESCSFGRGACCIVPSLVKRSHIDQRDVEADARVKPWRGCEGTYAKNSCRRKAVFPLDLADNVACCEEQNEVGSDGSTSPLLGAAAGAGAGIDFDAASGGGGGGGCGAIDRYGSDGSSSPLLGAAAGAGAGIDFDAASGGGGGGGCGAEPDDVEVMPMSDKLRRRSRK